MKKFMHRSEGFTLIELMIVILIIAILVAIAVPVYLNARANAQRRTCQSNLRTVDSSIQAYMAAESSGNPPPNMAAMVVEPYKTLKAAPVCPAGTAAYTWVGGTPPSISCPNDTDHTI